jgi:hypothetical protein
MAKLASVRRSMDEDPTYARAMSMPKLTRFVREHPHLGIEVERSGSSAILVFNPAPATRFKSSICSMITTVGRCLPSATTRPDQGSVPDSLRSRRIRDARVGRIGATYTSTVGADELIL